MPIRNNCAQWLLRNVVLQNDHQIVPHDIYKEFQHELLENKNDPCSEEMFCKTIRSLFKGLSTKRRMVNGKSFTYIEGLDFKPSHQIIATHITPSHFKCPQGFMQFQNDSNKLMLKKYSNYTINRCHTLTKTITLNENTWSLLVGSQEVNLPLFGIDVSFNWTQEQLDVIATLVENLKFCLGKRKGEMSNYVYQENFHSDKSQMTDITYRSKYCTRVVGITAISDVCEKCIKYVSKCNDKDDDMVNIHDRSVILEDNDSKDFEEVAKIALNDCPNEMKIFIECQLENVQKTPHGRRWDPNFIAFCLSIYMKSPKVYEQMSSGGMFVLPSGRLLQYYKNNVDQNVGFNNEIVSWMRKEADRIGVSEEGRFGGLILDEMSIQEDLSFQKKSSSFVLIGQKDLGPCSNFFDIISKESCNLIPAKYVPQFVFLGYTGFRFPVAHFPCTGASASELYLCFWNGVDILNEYGFTVEFSSLDGAVSNRSFLTMHFNNDDHAIEQCFLAKCPMNPEKSVVMMQDIKHNIKKIRNGIIKSCKDKKGTRHLKINNRSVTWSQWWAVYHWNRSHNLPLYRKLSKDHVQLSNSLKMRNKLAEEVLNKDMLNAFESYSQTTSHPEDYEGAILLLQNTSILVDFAKDFRPIHGLSDPRLNQLDKVFAFFNTWENCAKNSKELLSKECRFDIKCYLLSFKSLCEKVFTRNANNTIVPSRINSDVVENIFCQQRGVCNGLNRNPTYKSYGPSCTAITLSQTLLSKKCNSGSDNKENAKPFHKVGPLKRKSSSFLDCEIAINNYTMEYNILSEEQEQIISLALSGHNIFVTGQAGTGKTTMLRKLVNKYKDTEKQVYVTCTTGVSTMQFENATTIHHWSGIGDGRYTNDEIINKIMNDENFTSCKHRIKSTNVIIIDELAMLSAKNFAQIEKIVRTVKESNILFGGITVIGCGSFKQLAPIANARYFDAGDYCFNVNFWNDLFPQSHCFVLQEVFRTSDFKLIKAINELEEGLPSKETEMFLRSLDRPITAPSDDEIVRLFAKTDDVEMFNSDKLKVLPNDVHTYKCKDINVTKKNSKSFVVPKTLRLKEGAPVLLISNISVFKKLVNGKKGQVVKCNKDSVDVLFDDGSLSVITKVTFTQYDPLTKKVTCMREQIPLILAFAMTVHRSQGMTLHFLEIDCAGMFAPGQMAVAVGRASTIKGLRLRNYNPYAAKLRHKDDVYQFYTKLDSIPTYSVYCTETYPFDTKCCHNDYLDPDKPLYSDNEFNKIEYLPSLKNDIINIVDSMLAIEEQFDQASDIEEPILPLFNIKDIFKFDLENPCTTQQRELLHVYKTLPKQNLIKLWNSIIIFINAHLHPLQGPVAKDWTNFMSQIHSYLTSDTFAQVKEDIFKDVNVSSRDITGSFSFKCAMKALERCLEKKAQKFIPIVESSSEVNLDESSQAVIRYVAGYIVSSLKKKSKRVYEGKHKQDEDCLYSKWQVLNKFEVSFQVLKESTRYPNSLQELDRRMNERGGLCCVNDEVYEMFLDIFRICAKYLLPSNFKTYGTEIGSFAINAVTNDEKIIKKWFEYCCFSIIAECNEDNTDKTWALLSCLLDEMVTIFVNIMLNDLRKKVVDDIGLTKSQALRDKVNNPSTSKTTATVRKTSKSHQALQKNVHSSSDSEENIEYPCCVCNKECIADCIECSYCKVWVHFLCAGITDEDSVVTNDNEEFKCRKCASKTGKGKRLRKKKRYD